MSYIPITPVSVVYCSDEDVVVRAGPDFPLICPINQVVAKGNDGVFAPAPGGSWTLASASCDFLGLGTAPGNVVRLTMNAAGASLQDAAFGVAAVATGQVTLKRIGMAAGAGQPPGPPAGAAGVAFLAITLAPQIEDASYAVDRKFGVSDRNPNQLPSELLDARELNQACVLTVLARMYMAASRDPGSKDDDFAAKAAVFKAELDDVMASLILHWQSFSTVGVGGESEPSSSKFGTRLSR